MLASDFIRTLKLVPHPEGGYYREIRRSDESLADAVLSGRYGGRRSLYSSIYYLLQRGECSRLHRLLSDELWCLLAGGSLVLHSIDSEGHHSETRLGGVLDQGECLETVVRRGLWFGGRVEEPGTFALVSCIVVPGFEFNDLELGERESLLTMFPAHRNIIESLT